MCVCVIICLRFPPLLQNFLFCTYIILYILFMMTSVVTDAARGNRDRALQQTTHTSQPQKQIQVSATHTPSVRCDIWTGQSIYIWLCFDYGCRLSLGHSGTDPTRPGDLRQKWCRFWGQSPAGEQHQNNFCFFVNGSCLFFQQCVKIHWYFLHSWNLQPKKSGLPATKDISSRLIARYINSITWMYTWGNTKP